MRADQQQILHIRNHGERHADRAVVQFENARIAAPLSSERVQVHAIRARIAAAVVLEQLPEQSIKKSGFIRQPRKHRRGGDNDAGIDDARRRDLANAHGPPNIAGGGLREGDVAPGGAHGHVVRFYDFAILVRIDERTFDRMSVTQSTGCGSPGRRTSRNR